MRVREERTIIKGGLTKDIVQSILLVFQKSWKADKKYLPNDLKGQSLEQTCFNVWKWVKANVAYQKDPAEKQYILHPYAVIRQGYSDCKGYTILVNAILSNMGIHSHFRFVKYEVGGTIKHVYTVVKRNGKILVIDCCVDQFGKEVNHKGNQDYMATEIIEVSGINGDSLIQCTPISGVEYMSEDEFSQHLRREQLELERAILMRNPSVDGAYIDAYTRQIDEIGFLKKFGKWVKKAGKNVAKAAIKVASAPLRLAIKAILEVTLPKAAPNFLYLFIPQSSVSSMPQAVQKKRKKQAKRAKFITKHIGMKEDHIMKILRNGIMKRMGRTPEQLLSVAGLAKAKVRKIKYGNPNSPKIRILPKRSISGIGDQDQEQPKADAGGYMDAANAVLLILQKIAKLFGKKDDLGDVDETPDLMRDFSGLEEMPDNMTPYKRDAGQENTNDGKDTVDIESSNLGLLIPVGLLALFVLK